MDLQGELDCSRHDLQFHFGLDGNALIEARHRGVAVQVAVEKQQSTVQGNEVSRLTGAGVGVR